MCCSSKNLDDMKKFYDDEVSTSGYDTESDFNNLVEKTNFYGYLVNSLIKR